MRPVGCCLDAFFIAAGAPLGCYAVGILVTSRLVAAVTFVYKGRSAAPCALSCVAMRPVSQRIGGCFRLPGRPFCNAKAPCPATRCKPMGCRAWRFRVRLVAFLYMSRPLHQRLSRGFHASMRSLMIMSLTKSPLRVSLRRPSRCSSSPSAR